MVKNRRKKRRYIGLEPTITLTKTAISIPMVYGSLRPATRVPDTGSAISGVLPSVNASFNLMGLTGLTQTSVGLMNSVREFERITKKKRR